MFITSIHDANSLVARVTPEVEELLHEERVLELYVVDMAIFLSQKDANLQIETF